MSRIGTGFIRRIKRDLARYRRDGFSITDAEFDEWERELDGRHSTHGWDGVPPFVVLIGVRIVDADGNQRRWPKANAAQIGTCPDCYRPVALTRRGMIARHGWKASQPATDLRGFHVGRDHTETRSSCTGSGKPPHEPTTAEAKEAIARRREELAADREDLSGYQAWPP